MSRQTVALEGRIAEYLRSVRRRSDAGAIDRLKVKCRQVACKCRVCRCGDRGERRCSNSSM
jgi:NADPH-dependent glutamate synthase beta subunit-like oxidoreductase